MKEQDLIDLNFKVNNISAKESGDRPFRYYTFQLSKNNLSMCLISCANDETKNGEWYVSFLECDDLVYTDKNRVKIIIEHILN